MRKDIYPLTFEPQLRDYVWGGRRLAELYGRALPPGITAESWEISGHPTAPTRVEQGFWRGRTLPEVLQALGEELVGAHSAAMLARGRFPLLIKLLDAHQDLSVQVHPDDAYALQRENGELGKTEMWYVLHAEPGAKLIYGLRRGATAESIRAAIANQTLVEQLHRLPIAPGDVIFIPAGAVHALLAGVVVAEIQQNSDTTYRLYDWGRLGADGKPRPLHVERALAVMDMTLIEPSAATPTLLQEEQGLNREALVTCDKFVVEKLTLAHGRLFAGRCAGATFEIWGCIEGSARLRWTGAPLDLAAIRFCLLPAVLGDYTIEVEQAATLLRVYLP